MSTPTQSVKTEAMNRQRFIKPYIWSVVAVGIVACLHSAYHLPVARLDLHFVLLALITISITSRISIQIPRLTAHITVSDTLVFLIMLLYGGDAAVLIAAAEGLSSTSRISKRPRTLLFNTSQIACATFLTGHALRLCFGRIIDLPRQGLSASFIAALVVMVLVQYVANSGLAAVYEALKGNQPVAQTWVKHYLWTSITYVAGASAAGIGVILINSIGFYSAIITTPIIGIIYFTYQTYLKNVKTAEEHAEQAQRHVEELNHYIAEQERIREQFSQIEKLSALGELASGVAHDFNNTLAAILGRAQLMAMRNRDPEVNRGLKIIAKAAEDGAKTVKRIQDFARQRRDHDFAPVAVDQLLLDVAEVTRPRWKDLSEANNVHISLDTRIRSKALVNGDASELREVLVNMIFNAVDAMPTGGRLTLSAEDGNECVEICVGDTGVGMSPEVRSRIFDPFFTTKGQAGLGLGLAVSYGIVRRHEGTFKVESEVGRGTTFRISLPIAVGVAPPQTESEECPRLTLVTTSNKPRILVVDDEPCVRELMGEILEFEGYDATLAANGNEALKLFQPGKFDAVFTDVGMPGMNGWELARAIRELDREVPLAVITGWGEAVSSDEQVTAQVNWVVTKPFKVRQVTEITAEISLRRNNLFRSMPAVAMSSAGTRTIQ
jgi:signal transduction histidine kinase/ActR/RegA family two-component response regulator